MVAAFPLSALHYHTTSYPKTSPVVPGTRVVVELKWRKPGVHNTHQSARQHSSGQRNRPITTGRRQKPASEPGDARAKPQIGSSNLNGREATNRDARCRDRPITARDPQSRATPPGEGRGLVTESGLQPPRPAAAAFLIRSFALGWWGGGPAVCLPEMPRS